MIKLTKFQYQDVYNIRVPALHPASPRVRLSSYTCVHRGRINLGALVVAAYRRTVKKLKSGVSRPRPAIIF